MTLLDVAIFSYNRPDYLRNCVSSVVRNMPDAKVRVYDDGSDLPEMQAYLKEISDIVVQAPETSKARHGGLYANMNAAFQDATSPYLLMLQDDMQVVRPVGQDDLAQIELQFEQTENCVFVSPLFMKQSRIRRFRRELTIRPETRSYVSTNVSPYSPKTCLSYFDSHILHVDRLRAADWVYRDEEGASRDYAGEVFGAMPMLADPFAFFCPEVPFFRSRETETLAARLARRVVGKDLKNFKQMTHAEVTALKERSLDQWPIAEDFLTPASRGVRRPFVYKDVAARWWLYALHKFETKLKS